MENKILIVATSDIAKVFQAFGIDLLLVSEDDAQNKLNDVDITKYALIIYQSNLVDALKDEIHKYSSKPTPIFLNIPIDSTDQDESLTVLKETIENTLGVQIL